MIEDENSLFGTSGFGFRDEGLGFRVQASGFGVWSVGFRFQILEFRVQDWRVTVEGLAFRDECSGMRVHSRLTRSALHASPAPLSSILISATELASSTLPGKSIAQSSPLATRHKSCSCFVERASNVLREFSSD